MTNRYAGVNTPSAPQQIIVEIGRQRSILECDIDVRAITRYGEMTDEEAETSMHLFIEQVMPQIRATARGQAACGARLLRRW